MRRVTIAFQGSLVEGDQVEFEAVGEPWSEFRLEDGTRLRFRAIVMKIVRLDQRTHEGEPVYIATSQNLLVVDVPPELMAKKDGGGTP